MRATRNFVFFIAIFNFSGTCFHYKIFLYLSANFPQEFTRKLRENLSLFARRRRVASSSPLQHSPPRSWLTPAQQTGETRLPRPRQPSARTETTRIIHFNFVAILINSSARAFDTRSRASNRFPQARENKYREATIGPSWRDGMEGRKEGRKGGRGL